MYDDLLNEFKGWVTSNKEAKAYWQKVNNGTATYADATSYSGLVGRKWSEMLLRDYGIADEEYIAEIVQSLGKAYSETAYYTKNVQQIANNEARIGMKVQEPKIDEDRIQNLITKMLEEQNAGKDASWLVGKDVVENVARTAVTDTIEYNARVQEEAGLETYVERDGSNCCDWCASMTGRYRLGEQPADFWRVHKDCNCLITYKASKRPIQRIRFVSNRKVTI